LPADVEERRRPDPTVLENHDAARLFDDIQPAGLPGSGGRVHGRGDLRHANEMQRVTAAARGTGQRGDGEDADREETVHRR
jgi:hypothetical protein